MCSNALLLIGENTINSFTQGTTGSTVAANLYTGTYEDELTKHPWRFAQAKRQLARLTSTPLNQWNYAFQLPSDLLAVHHVHPNVAFDIYENKLYCNEQSIDLDYTFRPDESRLPAYFVRLMEFRLASLFAVPVAEDRSKADTYQMMYERQFAQAQFIDSQGRTATPLQRNPLIDVRG